MNGWFITGTDTEIGKTRVSAALLRTWVAAGHRAVGFKPVAAGGIQRQDGPRNEDALALAEAGNLPLPYAEINPYLFDPPIAPHIAAEEAGVRIDPARIRDGLRAALQRERPDRFLVEGVGGWCVPLGPDLMLTDLVRALDLPVILVVGLRLGCLNHALLTARGIQHDGLELAGWIANHLDPQMDRQQPNIEALDQRLSAPRLGVLDHGGKRLSGWPEP